MNFNGENLPMPGETLAYDDHFRREVVTVIASAYVEIDDGPDEHHLLLLRKKEPFYLLSIVTDKGVIWAKSIENIIPAAKEYQESSGCW